MISLILLFFLMCGLSATVDFKLFKSKFEAKRGIAVGVFCQFFVMPFLGFSAAKLFNLPSKLGIALMVMTSSPGGAFSGLWCSIFNADLALSVAMTTCSTICSIFMLPLNLYVYVNTLYGTNVVVPWATLAINIAVAIGATVIGLFIGAKLPLYRDKFNTLGNLSGIILIMMALVPQDKQEATGHSGNMTAEAAELHMLNAEGWCDGVFGFGRPAAFYMATAMPCFLGLFVALGAASLPCLGLIKEERVAISVETLYQNTGLALSIALSAFSDPCAVTAASGVPLFYGAVEALLLPGLLAVSWRIGWTYAPAKESCWVVVKSNYQPSAVEAAHRKLSVAESALELTKSQGGTAEQITEQEELLDVAKTKFRTLAASEIESLNEQLSEAREAGQEENVATLEESIAGVERLQALVDGNGKDIDGPMTPKPDVENDVDRARTPPKEAPRPQSPSKAPKEGGASPTVEP